MSLMLTYLSLFADYPDYTAEFSEYQTQVKYEDDEGEQKFRPNPGGNGATAYPASENDYDD